MKKFKNYKEYFVDRETWKNRNKIETIKELLKTSNKDLKELETNWRHGEALTNRQFELLKNKDIKALKPLLKKQLEKELKKLDAEKEKAIEKYNKIAELGDIKKAIIEVEWSQGRGAYGYQSKGFARVWYKNGDFKSFETGYTSGCGYDKPSTTLSQIGNELLQIVILKHFKKIATAEDSHYKFYAAEPFYFQYGVGVSSYENLFKNLKYKTTFQYLRNENIYIEIEK